MDLKNLSLTELIVAFEASQQKINSNDGRLTEGSSDQLDMDMHEQEEIAKEIRDRLGCLGKRERPEDMPKNLTYRLQCIEGRLRLGNHRRGTYELLDGYLQIAPFHCWRDELIHGLIEPLKRGEKPRWIRWAPGAWIFRNEKASRGYPSFGPGGRWGFGILGIEIGSRDPSDPLGCWLKDHGLWPW